MRIAALLLVPALLLSGCTQNLLGTDIPQVPLPGAHGSPAGTPSGHGAPQVDRGQVAVSREGSHWRATQVIEVSNGFGGADRAAASLASLNGGIDVQGTDGNGYHGTVTLHGTGTSEQMARDALATLELRTPDSLDGTSLSFGLQVVATTTSLPSEAGRGGSIDLETPRGPLYSLGADTSNGGIHLKGLRGDRLSGDTSNGDVTLTDIASNHVGMDTSNGGIKANGFAATDATLATSNGGIDIDGAADTITLDTSNGPIDAKLQPTATGHYTLDSSNGQITLKLKGDGQTGFDATASTSNGRASITLAGGEAVGSQDTDAVHVRTAGFSGKAVQATIVADTSNADIHITQG
jgi:hypothetical protein